MNSKHEKVVRNIEFKIEDVEGLKKQLDDLKRWYNDHWYMSKDIMMNQAKTYVSNHVKIVLAEEEKI